MCHVVHVRTTIEGNQTETAEPWKRLITLLQTQHKEAPTGETCPEPHYEWLHPMELEERENLSREWAKPPKVQSEPSQQFEESPSAPQSNASAKERAEDWEEDPGVHNTNEILHVPSVVSSVRWQTRTRRPMNLKHTPNFTNNKQLTASLGTRLQSQLQQPKERDFKTIKAKVTFYTVPVETFKHYLIAVNRNSTQEHYPGYLKTHAADTCLLISRRVICIHDVMTDSGQPETHENTVHQSTVALPTSSNRGSCM